MRILGGEYSSGVHGLVFGGAASNVTNFTVANALIRGNSGNGIYIINASGGMISGNLLRSNNAAIVEVAPSSSNVYVGNRMLTNTAATQLTLGATSSSQAVRNLADPGKTIADTGGFRQTIDGWSIDPTEPYGTPMWRLGETDPAQRFRAVRKGSITGLLVMASVALVNLEYVTIKIYKNDSGVADDPGSELVGFSVTLDVSNPTRNFAIWPEGTLGLTFNAGDELYLVFEKAFSPLGLVRAALEIED